MGKTKIQPTDLHEEKTSAKYKKTAKKKVIKNDAGMTEAQGENNLIPEKEKMGKRPQENTSSHVIKKRSKRYQKKAALVDKSKFYALAEALDLLEKTSYARFDPTVETHFTFNIDPGKTDQLIRVIVKLPHGTGKKLKILAFGDQAELEKAKKAGATHLGDDKTIEKIKGGWFDFDKIVASPAMMPQLSKIAPILGPKGLMPNPKAGTVTQNLEKAIADLMGGSVEVRNEKNAPLAHVVVGKISFGKSKLEENFNALLSNLKSAKPAKVKEPFIKSVVLSSTMSPGIKITLDSAA